MKPAFAGVAPVTLNEQAAGFVVQSRRLLLEPADGAGLELGFYLLEVGHFTIEPHRA